MQNVLKHRICVGLSFAPATMCEMQGKMSAIRSLKFHTDDINLQVLKWHN